MSIKIGEKKILRSPLEPKDNNWLWLKTVAGFPVLHEYLSGKWVPFSDATAEYMETHILSRVFGSTRYDKDNHCIEFYAADGSDIPIGIIDTSEFEVSIDADDYYTKTETEEFVAEYVSQYGGGGGYEPPVGGIPKTDLASDVQSSLDAADNAYQKPSGGIPSTDMTSAVQTSLGKADTAYQKPSGGIPASDLASGVIPDVSGFVTSSDVQTAIAGLVDSAPETLDTLNELAAALGDDKDFATTMSTALGNKVDKETGKGLSTNDYTTAEKNKLAGLSNYDDTTLAGRVTTLENAGYLTTETDPTVPSWAKASSKPSYTASEVGAVPTTRKVNNKALSEDITLSASDVGAVSSTGYVATDNNFTSTLKDKLDGIEAGAEVNVQADWGQTTTTADDYIKNKPTLATVATSGSYSDLSGTPTIPTKVSDLTNDSGFTSNAGTITGITMNGASKGTSGVVNLGTVITAHQDISGKANTADLAIVATSGSYNDLSNKPTIPTVDTTITQNSTNAAQSGAVYTALAGKQNTLTFDNAPTSGSNNPVKSGGVYTALAGKQNTLTFDSTPTASSTKPVTSGGIKTYVDGKATITGITTSQDGTFTISLSDGNSYTVNLNHVHTQYYTKTEIDTMIGDIETILASI